MQKSKGREGVSRDEQRTIRSKKEDARRADFRK